MLIGDKKTMIVLPLLMLAAARPTGPPFGVSALERRLRKQPSSASAQLASATWVSAALAERRPSSEEGGARRSYRPKKATTDRHRYMQQQEEEEEDGSCNKEIGRLSGNEILQALQSSPLGMIDNGASTGSAIRYGISVWKVCGSCAELFPTSDADSSPPPEVCDPEAYGYDAVQSAVVMVPTDPATGGGYVAGRLRGVETFRGTKIDVVDAPSQTVMDAFSEVDGGGENGRPMALTSLLEFHPEAAAAGAIVIAPDFLGYGSSLPTHNRTYGVMESYQQAAVVSWLATQNWIERESGGCTLLDDVVSMEGTSEGGYAVLAASMALRQSLGLRILHVMASAPFIDHQAVAYHIIDSYDRGLISTNSNNILFQFLLPLPAFSWSSEMPGMANTGTGQIALSSNWTDAGNERRNVIAWMESPDPIGAEEIMGLMPTYAPEILNPQFLRLFKEAIAANNTKPCTEFLEQSDLVERKIDKLCEALVAGDLEERLASIDYPTTLCYSDEDTVIPSFQFTDDIYDNPFVTKDLSLGQSSPLPGDHVEVSMQCAMNSVMYLLFGLTSKGPPSSPDDSPFLVNALDASEQEVCSSYATTPGTPPASDNSTGSSDGGAPDGGGSSSAAFSFFACAPILLSMLVASSAALLGHY